MSMLLPFLMNPAAGTDAPASAAPERENGDPWCS
jgi:hypothetical protein